MEFYALVQQCGINRPAPQVMASIAKTESNFNPFAIGVVKGYISQPRNHKDAVAAVKKLQRLGKNYSVGLVQVNKINFATYGLKSSNMFDPCTNLRAGADIFNKCYDRATRKYGSSYSHDGKLRLAMSCYYSGNFKTGFRRDFPKQPPYVTKVYNNLKKFRGKPNRRIIANQQQYPIQAQHQSQPQPINYQQNQPAFLQYPVNFVPVYLNQHQPPQETIENTGIAKVVKKDKISDTTPKKSAPKKSDLFATNATADLFL